MKTPTNNANKEQVRCTAAELAFLDRLMADAKCKRRSLAIHRSIRAAYFMRHDLGWRFDALAKLPEIKDRFDGRK